MGIDIVGKIWYINIGFRGKVLRHHSVGLPTPVRTGYESQRTDLQIQNVLQSR